MKYETFKDWYCEQEGCAIRAERLHFPMTPEGLRKWLEAAFLAARECSPEEEFDIQKALDEGKGEDHE